MALSLPSQFPTFRVMVLNVIVVSSRLCWKLSLIKAGFHMIADRNKVCDRLRSAIIWKPAFSVEVRSRCRGAYGLGGLGA